MFGANIAESMLAVETSGRSVNVAFLRTIRQCGPGGGKGSMKTTPTFIC